MSGISTRAHGVVFRYARAVWIRILAGLCLTAVWCAESEGAAKIWIDTDLSLGSPLREADDGYALLLALNSPELQLIGVSATFGNAPVGSTYSRAQNFFRRFGGKGKLETPQVYRGATSAQDALPLTPAMLALRRALQQHRNVTFVALGPLTNLAAFATRFPREARRLKQIVLVAGKSPRSVLGFGPQQRFRIHDANYIKDRDAMRAVLRTNIPIVLAPIESAPFVSERTREEMLGAVGAPRFVARKSATWMRFWTLWVRERGAPAFDALAMMAVARPALVDTDIRYADAGDDLIAHRDKGANRHSVRFCRGLSPQAQQFLRARLVRNASGRQAKSAPPRQR